MPGAAKAAEATWKLNSEKWKAKREEYARMKVSAKATNELVARTKESANAANPAAPEAAGGNATTEVVPSPSTSPVSSLDENSKKILEEEDPESRLMLLGERDGMTPFSRAYFSTLNNSVIQ